MCLGNLETVQCNIDSPKQSIFLLSCNTYYTKWTIASIELLPEMVFKMHKSHFSGNLVPVEINLVVLFGTYTLTLMSLEPQQFPIHPSLL